MNRVLYLLVGVSFAGLVTLAFFESRDIGPVTSKDVQAVIGFALLLATGAYVLIHSRRGRAWRQRFDQQEMDAEDQARTRIRTNGELPPPRGS